MIRNASPTVRALFELAEQEGYTQSALAAVVDGQPKDVWRWREGRRMPNVMTLEAIGAALGYRLEWVK